MKARQKIMSDSADGCFPYAGGFAIGLLICLLLSLCSCKLGKEIQVERVEVPVVVTQEHTVESVKIDHVRDTLIQRDSVIYWQNGDTVRIEKWHYLQGSTNVVRVDTLHVYDSVPYPVKVETVITKVEEVEKKLKWYQKLLMWIGGIAMIAGALGVAWKVGKNKLI